MTKSTLNINGQLFDLSEPVVMGIINLTPDSFYNKSRSSSVLSAIKTADKMLAEGAAILDLGGFSTRPGAKEVDQAEERRRLLPALREIRKEHPGAIISVDSFRSTVAKPAIDEGASLINDITGGSDPAMFPLIGHEKVPYIMMHMRGTATTMLQDTDYSNLLHEMTLYFKERIVKLQELGAVDIIIDPGFGFSKSLEQNYEILKNLAYFEGLEQPILVGVSRKSMIYKFLETSPEEALNGTSVLNYESLLKGARILRVHDVKEAVETIKLYKKIAC
jgi:dihydropteroate synthase